MIRGTKLLAIATVCFSLSSCATLSTRLKTPQKPAAGYEMVNTDNPGEQTNVKSSMVFGKYTIIELTSKYCGVCEEMKPYLMRLHDARPDIVVRAFDIDRKGSSGIDFESPLADQYGIHFVPFFYIYNDKGVKIAEGQDASKQIMEVIQKEASKIEH